MEITYIEELLSKRNRKAMGILHNYAVLIPLIIVDDEWHLLFEVRSEKLDTQPNEISFPGGKVEKGETFRAAAIRETSEELNIEMEKIKVLGEIDYIVSPYNISIYGFVGILKNIEIEDIKYNKDEVAHIFTVPLDFFVDNEPKTYYTNLKVTIDEDFPYHMIQNGKEYNWREGRHPVHFYVYEDYVIWGMTARFINNFLNIIKKNSDEDKK